MPRLTPRDRSRLALDILAKSFTDSELARRYGIHRSNVTRLRHFLEKSGAITNATGDETASLRKEQSSGQGQTQQEGE